MEKELGKKIQEGQRTSNRLDQKKQSSLQHITIKLSLDEHSEKILKYACDKSQLTYIGTPIRRELQSRREWSEIFQIL